MARNVDQAVEQKKQTADQSGVAQALVGSFPQRKNAPNEKRTAASTTATAGQPISLQSQSQSLSGWSERVTPRETSR